MEEPFYLIDKTVCQIEHFFHLVFLKGDKFSIVSHLSEVKDLMDRLTHLFREMTRINEVLIKESNYAAVL